MSQKSDQPVLSIRGLSKAFGGTQALSGVDLDIEGGCVHALLGHNGSGKSTLIKILSGYHLPDAGELHVRGTGVKLPLSSATLRELGIAFTHQDLGLVETMSVLENLRLGRYRTGRGGRIRWQRERARTRELLGRFELDVDPDRPVAKLSQTQRSILGIARAFQDIEAADVAGLLVLDEPTVALPEHEVDVLFKAVRRVTEAGSSVLFVTHRLEEVLAISDRVSVLRDGRLVGSALTRDLDERALVRMIVGRDLGALYPDTDHRPSQAVLEVTGLSGQAVRDATFTLHEGEILGVTGLVGSGHEELPYLIYGARRPERGEVRIDGRALRLASARDATRAGLALLPADRPGRASIPGASVTENVTMPRLGAYARIQGLDKRRERADVQQVLGRFDVRPADPDRRFSTLSGGNQQKALLGRWLATRPRVLLLDEPTQGVDVEACRSIFSMLSSAAQEGLCVLYVSTDYDDLANVCDRVLVLGRGRIVGELSGEGLTHERIVERCYASASAATAVS